MEYVQSTIVDTAQYFQITLTMVNSFNKIVSLHKIVIEKSINAMTDYASHNLIYKACYEVYSYTRIDVSTYVMLIVSSIG